ncbi:hypothetical protein CEXT_562661 [Caerostris extrusa]|uniref:Uncharacterized protein n=1 Tax=Caerostris extrusa TaxID=172846 RepID=A0AAV4XID7_CAEEX|nr:hypothetical protein CEXT_562661 [Caerostris extrusa]
MQPTMIKIDATSSSSVGRSIFILGWWKPCNNLSMKILTVIQIDAISFILGWWKPCNNLSMKILTVIQIDAISLSWVGGSHVITFP